MGYLLQEFPQDQYRFVIYINSKKKTWQQIKKETGCYALCNLGYYDMLTFRPCAGLTVGGKTFAAPKWHQHGLCIDGDGRASCNTEDSAAGQINYCVAQPPMYVNGKKSSSYKNHAKNGTTMVGIRKDAVVVLMAGKDEPMTSAIAVKHLLNAGCTDILRYDGSWSTQGSLGPGKDLQPSKKRIVHNYLLIYARNGAKQETTTSNDIIKTIQARLNSRYGAGIAVDGKFGPASRKAMVKAAQTEINRSYGGNLTVDGSFGAKSRAACPTIKKGTKGEMAWIIQACLNIKGYPVDIDSSYGGNTATAVQKFQRANGLTANGACGPSTFKKLLGG